MRITIITSNNLRHNYLINQMSKISKRIYVIQECKPKIGGSSSSFYKKSKQIFNYFLKVTKSQKKIFKNTKSEFLNLKNLKLITLNYGDLNFLNWKKNREFFKSDIYIVFGSSFIRGSLCNFLVRNKAINIHMGISPYYKGSDCNFWAAHDSNSNLVGATIHYLSKGLDSGKILYHSLPKHYFDPFMYSMSSVKSAIDSLSKRIKDNTIFNIKSEIQDKSLLIRYSKKKDFNMKSIKKFYKIKKIKRINFDKKFFKDPIFSK